jgi:hypothetical protein
MSDPIYHPKSGERFALTAAAQKYFTYEGNKLWHERMGHADHKVVAELGKVDITGVNLKSAPDEEACAECVQAKKHASSMNHSLVPEGTKIGELVFGDGTLMLPPNIGNGMVPFIVRPVIRCFKYESVILPNLAGGAEGAFRHGWL